MSIPLVTVVMPSLNQGRFIRSAVESVLSQGYANLELVVADGGSTDETLEILQQIRQRDGRLRYSSSNDGGPAQAINKALADAKGTIIGWLNSDDLYCENAVARAVTQFQDHPDWLMVYGNGCHIDAEGNPLERYPTLPPTTAPSKFLEGCFICQPTVFFRLSQTFLIGKLDEELKCAFDFDYWIRAFRAFQDRIGFLDELQAYSRLHGESITVSQRESVILESMRVLARHFGTAPKTWVLTYLDEMLGKQLSSSDGQAPLAVALAFAEKAKPYLSINDYQTLLLVIQHDQRLTVELPAHVGKASAAADATESTLVKPQAVIERYSLQEHLSNADTYFEGRADHWYLYQKPFYHPQDCAPALSNLGCLFSGLSLQAGMTVLDFAAGSCWLSRVLVQMGCKVVCSDVSKKALEIGQELFRRFPPVMDEFDLPQFLIFDGQSLALPDESMDRVIVNDAFHHVANQELILSELYRVLRPGGIVGMSEPGRFHSRTEASQYEMTQFRVIENDIVVEDIWAKANSAGFARIEICPIIRSVKFNLDEYLDCIEGKQSPKLAQAVMQDTLDISIFFLHKAPLAPVVSVSTPHGPMLTREEFSEPSYLERYPDVDRAVRRGQFKDGWQHYVSHGYIEGRRGK